MRFGNDFLPSQPTTAVTYRANLASYPLTTKHDTSVPGSELLNVADFTSNPSIIGTPATPFVDATKIGVAQTASSPRLPRSITIPRCQVSPTPTRYRRISTPATSLRSTALKSTSPWRAARTMRRIFRLTAPSALFSRRSTPQPATRPTPRSSLAAQLRFTLASRPTSPLQAQMPRLGARSVLPERFRSTAPAAAPSARAP